MKLIRWLFIFAVALPVAAQNVRFDLPIYTVQAQGGNLLPVYAIPGALVSFYNEPAGTLANTYNSATSTSPCPTSAQVVLNGSAACVSSADPYGNMGAWFLPGQYMATITASGRSYNYYFTIGGSGGSGSSYGYRFASNYGDGSTNGIATAAATAPTNDQTIIANPSYPNTEIPTIASFPAAPFRYINNRNSLNETYCHDPAAFQWDWPYYGWAERNCFFDTMMMDGLSYNDSAPTAALRSSFLVSTTPGWDWLNGTGSEWLAAENHGLRMVVNSAGIFQNLTCDLYRYGIGDTVCGYFTLDNDHNGWTAPSDEGTKPLAVKVDEDTNTYTGTIVSGGTAGSTSIQTTAVTDAGTQGVGQYLIDTTQAPCTGTYTTQSGESVTVSSSCVTASQAWGILNGNCTPPLNTTPPFSTPTTCSITVTSGAFTASSTIPICFGGTAHEQVFATAATGSGTQSVTFPLRKLHASGTPIYQGGMCGYSFEETAYNQSPNGQTLRYLFDVIGSQSTTNLQVVTFLPNGAQGAPLHSITWQTVVLCSGFGNGGSGTTVTFSVCGGGTLESPYHYVGSTFTISGSSDSSLNTACTNTQWTGQFAGTCTIAALSGSHTSTTTGTMSLGLNQFKLWPMAEILDVQNETLSPPQVDGTLNLEPNIIPFANGDTVENPHHSSALMQGQSLAKFNYNPYQYGGLLGGTWEGAGANGGSATPASPAILNYTNENSDSIYLQNGGFLAPPNYISMTGSYSFGFITDHGPAKGGAWDFITPSSAQAADPSYCFQLWQISGGPAFQDCPNTQTSLLDSPGTMTYDATAHKFEGAPVNAVSGYQVNGNLVLPTTVTGYHGNSAGVRVPLAVNWTNSAGALLCDDGNGNITTAACSGGGGGVTSINSTTGAMTFTGSGVTQSGNTFTFSGGTGTGCGTGTPCTIAEGGTNATTQGGAQINLGIPQFCVDSSGSTTAYVCSTPVTFTAASESQILFVPGSTSTTPVTLAVNGGSAVPIRPATTFSGYLVEGYAYLLSYNAAVGGSWTVVGYSPSVISLETNGTENITQSSLNFITSTVNTTGLVVTPSNPASSEEKSEITGTYTGTVAASQLSGTVATTNGGTAQNTSSSTGVAQVNAGTWSVSTALANGTTATTQTTGDNSTKVATDAFVLANASGGSSVGTAGQIQMVGSTAGSFAASALTDNGTTLSASEPISIAAGGSSNITIGVAGSATGSLTLESSTPTGGVTLTPASAASQFAATLPAATDTVVELAQTQTLTNKSIAASEINSGQLAVANGGTGTATPGLIAGTNITSITGTWPNQTINASGGGISPVYNTATSGQTGNLSAVTMVTPGANHDYLYNWSAELSAAGTGCTGSTTVVLNITFQSINGGSPTTQALGTLTIANNGVGTVGFVAEGSDNILAKSGTAVQFSTSSYTLGAGCTGTNPTYIIYPTLVQLW